MDVDHGLLSECSEELLIERLLESSAQLPLHILDTDPHPSNLTLALLAKAVYTQKSPIETDEAYGDNLVLPEGWRLLMSASNPDFFNGYFGSAFVHTELQQVAIAHRGTDPTKVGALYTDVKGILMNKYTSCMNSAVTFVDHIRQAIHVVNSEPYGMCYNLSLTGHSLGGWLAQVTAFTVKFVKVSNGALIKTTSGGVHAKTVVFDSPGAKAMLIEIQDKHYNRLGTVFVDRLDRLDITVYVSAPNLVNTCGAHLRTVYRVLIDLSKYTWEDMDTVFYTAKTHAIGNFVEAFKETSPNIREVLDWARDSHEYKALFKDQTLNQANDFHAEINKIDKVDYFEEIKKRYRVVPSEPQINVISNLNTFSEDEVKILGYLAIIQKQPDITILNDFLLKKKLNSNCGKLFADFKINNNNRTISCETNQLLRELTMRVKQLMRWHKSEFSEAVEKQSKTTDLIYRAEGRKYLDSIEKTWLNFTDSIGLRNFLLSATERVFWIVTKDGAFEMTRLHNIIFSEIKTKVSVSDPLNKYTTHGHYSFLDWPRLQFLYNVYGLPVDQNDLMIVDCSSSTTITSEIDTFLNNYVQCTSPNMKKLVVISSHPTCLVNPCEKVKTFHADRTINLLDLSVESQQIIFRRKRLIFTGNKGHSFQEFLGENSSILEFHQFMSSNCLKNIVTNEDFVIILKDTRPTINDIQMPFIKTNISICKENIVNCMELPNTLAVISGLNSADLEIGSSWDWLKRNEVILAVGDSESTFGDTCKYNQDKTIYLFEVSGPGVYCKKIFNRVFYLPRKFFHLAAIDIEKYAETKHPDDLFIICSEEDKSSVLRLTENLREAFTNHVLIADSKEMELDIIKKYFYKNIHFIKINPCKESYKLEWRYSHGSVESLLPCMSTDCFDAIDELQLSQTERNLVIITDEPGMGKTTSLVRLARYIESEWVIYIELKQFQIHIDSLSDEFTPQSVAKFLLGEYSSSVDHGVAHRLLEYLLESKMNSKRVVIMLDGFDELDDYVKGKESAKEKIVRLLIFLKNIPTVQIFITAREYLKKTLEEKLFNVTTSFLPIIEEHQLIFLVVFWRSCLSLELGDYGVEEEGRLKEYAREVLREAKRVLGPDMDCFMGVPLQLRMLAEVLMPQCDLFQQTPEDLFKQINIVSAPNLYQRFIALKYEIYFKEKTFLGAAADKLVIKLFFDHINEIHCKLGFRTLFPHFYNENFDPISEEWLNATNRHGLVQSKGNGDFQFVHRTYAEYCCAQMIVHWLNQRTLHCRYELFKSILVPQILLHPDSKIIRLFMNVQLNEIQMSMNLLELNAKCIGKLWLEDSATFRNQEHQTAFHVAIQEKNEYIVAFLLSGLNIASTQEMFVSLMSQYDLNRNTPLNMVDMPELYNISEDVLVLDKIMINILECVKTCSDETKEEIFFSCLFNRNISKSFENNKRVSFTSLFDRNIYKSDETEEMFFARLFCRNLSNLKVNDEHLIFINLFYRYIKKYLSCTSRIFDRVKEVEKVILKFTEAIVKNNVEIVKKILTKHLKNNVERYCLLLMRHEDHNMQTALHLAAVKGHLEMIKLFEEETSVPFAVLVAQRDIRKRTPLHTAGDHGKLNVVKYLVEHGADIDARCESGRCALMYAAQDRHLLTVKYLIESGADINATDRLGWTALYWAARGGHPLIVKYLLQQGADPYRVDRGGETVLTGASQWEKWDVVRLLLEWGVDVNADCGEALRWAILRGEWSIVKALVNKRASVKESQIPNLHNLSEFQQKFPNYEFHPSSPVLSTDTPL